MAEDFTAQERTEAATPRRRERARAEGNVARSVEIASVVVLGVGVAGLAGLGPSMAEKIADLSRRHFQGVGLALLDQGSAVALSRSVSVTMAQVVLPLAALVLLFGVSSHVAQTGIVFTGQPLVPKLNRISPATGLKRIFSRRGFVEFAKSLAKLLIVGGVIAWTLLEAFETLLPLMTQGLFPGFQAILSAMLKMAVRGCAALGILAILDFFFQRWDHEQHLKMTRQEIKEEHKQNEGDPLIRSRIRARQQEMSRRRMMQDVRTADVVVTNPIRFAVALKYEPAKMTSPRVVAKGARLLARRIREIAKEAGVPIVEDPPLARALYHACKIGSQVPISLYKAVAQLLAFVYRDREPARGGAR
jgi:flagellar biosynthetic protein FlhB